MMRLFSAPLWRDSRLMCVDNTSVLFTLVKYWLQKLKVLHEYCTYLHVCAKVSIWICMSGFCLLSCFHVYSFHLCVMFLYLSWINKKDDRHHRHVYTSDFLIEKMTKDDNSVKTWHVSICSTFFQVFPVMIIFIINNSVDHFLH